MKISRRNKIHNAYYVRLGLGILFCILFALMLVLADIQVDIRSAEKRFKARAESALAQIQHQLDSSTALITALTSWHHSMGNVSNDELTAFIHEMLSKYPHVHSVQYSPLVEQRQRPDFEQYMHEQGYASFAIKEKNRQNLITAANRITYFPITYVKPLYPENAQMLGFDMASLASTANALNLAIRSGQTVASMPEKILRGDGSFFLIKAVYKSKTIPSDENSRLQQVTGAYAVSILSGQLLQQIKSIMQTSNTRISLRHNKLLNNGIDNTIFAFEPEDDDLLQLLPTFYAIYDLQQIRQPFVLELQRKMQLDDLNTSAISAILLFALIMIFLVNQSLRRDLRHNIANITAQDDIFRQKELAEVTLNSIADGVITTDMENLIEHMNPVAEQLCGWPLQNAKKQPLENVLKLVNKKSGELVRNLFAATYLDSEGETYAKFLLKHHHGKEYIIRLSAAPIRDRDEQLMGTVIVFRDISNEHKMAELLAFQARHDGLTGLYNRREFEYQLRQTLEQAAIQPSENVLCFIDLDQFKLVNDTCGHIAGDELLKQVAQILRLRLRDNDTLARLGGDEFGIILYQSGLAEALELVTELQNAIREHRFVWDGKIFDIGSSMGLAPISQEMGSIEELMIAADSACYMAKDKGRNRISYHTFDDHELRKRQGEMLWTHRIKEAIESNRLCLYLQSVKPLQDSSAPMHHEILLRMIGESGDIITPMMFIPAAERYNVMQDLDKWVITHAFEMIARLGKTSDIYNINLSGKSIGDESLLSFIIYQLQRNNITTEQICFEITETAAIANLSTASELIEELRLMGCRFALDDFGSGLSSYSYLKNLPVDYLKIDGTFIRDMLRDPIDHAMVSSIVQIGHVMGIKTIAEYVEDSAIEQALRHLGVDYAQGYGIHRPCPWYEYPAVTQ